MRVVMSKWGDRPHWEFDALSLGSDHHGTWLGVPAGSRLERPGVVYVAPVDQVMLVPDHPYVATFHAPGGPIEVYVDITTVPSWEGSTMRAVDLDLDVLRAASGRTWVDDEDEFAEHRQVFGYPDDVVSEASRTCTAVHAAVAAYDPPFDRDTHTRWLAHLDQLGW